MGADSSELEGFIKATLKGIKNGVEDENYILTELIKFKIAVTTIKEGGGGIKIHVIDAGGKYKKEEISTVEFEISPSIDL